VQNKTTNNYNDRDTTTAVAIYLQAKPFNVDFGKIAGGRPLPSKMGTASPRPRHALLIGLKLRAMHVMLAPFNPIFI